MTPPVMPELFPKIIEDVAENVLSFELWQFAVELRQEDETTITPFPIEIVLSGYLRMIHLPNINKFFPQ